MEVLISMSILAIVLVAVFRLHLQSISMNNTSRFNTTAPLLLQQKLSEFEAESSEELSSGSGDFGDDFPGYRWNVLIDEVNSEALGTVTERLKQFDITVSFNQNEYVYGLRTYRFMQR